MDHERLSMPLGEAIFTLRSIRRLKTDPIPMADIELIIAAASKAPNGGNHQTARFLVLNDRAAIEAFGALYREAWWAKRFDEKGWTKREDIPLEEESYRNAALLADDIKNAPCIILAFSSSRGQASSVVPAVQNLLLAARALGIGSVPTTLHPSVMDRVREMFGVPAEADLHLCIPLGYPRGRFGPTKRRPTWETTYFNRWGAPVPWSPEPVARR